MVVQAEYGKVQEGFLMSIKKNCCTDLTKSLAIPLKWDGCHSVKAGIAA